MIKKILITLAFLVMLILGLLLLFDQSRSYYCIEGKQCITVWKRLGGTCYIIPGKYKALFKPKDSYIKTSTNYIFTIYFSDAIPDSWIVRREQPKKKGDIIFYNSVKKEPFFLDYDAEAEKYHQVLYPFNVKYREDLKDNADFITINIKESYARNKKGKLKSN